MAKTGKATKKFQKKHLKHTLDHRKSVQKHNKLKSSHKKKSSDETEAPKKSKEVFEDMSVEDFFEGGFEVPKAKGKKQESSEDEDSEEEEEEEQDDVSSEEEDIDAIQEDMKALEEKDPEFYKYLQNNDKDLLDFEGTNPLDAISDDDMEEDEEEEEEQEEQEEQPKEKKVEKTEITVKLVRQWEIQLKKPNTQIIRQICIAFKAAINVDDETNKYKYSVTNPKAFNELMLLTLKQVPDAIQKLVKYKTGANNVRVIPQKNENVRAISLILKSHASSFITLLNDINNTETATLVLFSLQEVFPYYLTHRRLLKELITSVVNIWSSTTEVQIQLATFAFLNNVSKEFSKSILETVLKSTYTIFLKNCRKTNHYTMPLLNFCKNSAAELYGIDETVSYQIGFEYVRQLAIHLRNSISATSNSKEGYKTIYNWQYCHSLDFWSRVLAQQCNPEKELVNHKSKESPLRQLIYPLVQVTLGAIRLIPTAQFFPLRFYLIRSLIRLSQSTGVFIPIFPLIVEVLNSTAVTKAPKRVNLPVFDFENNIKVNQQYLGTKVYQDGLTEQFVELTYEFFVLYSKSIAFPELATPAVIALRRFMKKSKNAKFNKQLTQLVEKLNENAKFITTKRANVEYGPSNKHEVSLFLNDFKWEKTPLGQYVVVQRKAKEERIKLLREALEQEEEARNNQKNDEDEELEGIASEDDDEDDEDEDDE